MRRRSTQRFFRCTPSVLAPSDSHDPAGPVGTPSSAQEEGKGHTYSWSWVYPSSLAARSTPYGRTPNVRNATSSRGAAAAIPLPSGWTKETRQVTLVLPLGDRLEEVTYWVNSVGMRFLPLPAGQFVMAKTTPPGFPTPRRHIGCASLGHSSWGPTKSLAGNTN